MRTRRVKKCRNRGGDPAFTKTTDHTREYTPWLIFGKKIKPVNLGTLDGFSHIAATVCDMLDVPYTGECQSKKQEILK